MIDIKDSRIMITGGAGFVGSFIVEQLLKEGVGKIVVLDNFFRGTENNIREALDIGKVHLIKGDIRNLPLIIEAFSGIDYCFHLAALRITHCAAEPREALSTMYDGTFNVLEACVDHKVKKIVLASSASVYGQADVFPTPETQHPYNNSTLYGAAKMANELMFRSFYQMYGLDYVALRFFNIYGPRMDTFGKYTEVLVRWYRLIKEGKSPLIYGDGKQTMDFVYVGDIARANIAALKADATNATFNIARGEETSLEELCLALIEVMGVDIQPEYIPLPEERGNVEVMRRLADVSQAREKLGFEAHIPLKEGLKSLVKWLDEQPEPVNS